jgi:translation initiation factor 1 (eIF-1/SUI1)
MGVVLALSSHVGFPYGAMAKRPKKKERLALENETGGFSNPFAALGNLSAPKSSVSTKSDAPPTVRNVKVFGPKVSMNIERKGRGGKTVTVIHGVLLRGGGLEQFVGMLKKALGVRASIEDGLLIVGGDQRERLRSWLESQGAPKVL